MILPSMLGKNEILVISSTSINITEQIKEQIMCTLIISSLFATNVSIY